MYHLKAFEDEGKITYTYPKNQDPRKNISKPMFYARSDVRLWFGDALKLRTLSNLLVSERPKLRSVHRIIQGIRANKVTKSLAAMVLHVAHATICAGR